MRQFLYKSLILQLLLLTILLAPSGLAMKMRGKKKKEMITKEDRDVCDNRATDAPFYCYCTGVQNGTLATNLDCLILKDFTQSDNNWNLFLKQTRLETLTLKVHQNGNLNHVPSYMLYELKTLREVTFQHVRLHEIIEHAFSNLNNMTKIDLSRNKIVVLRKYAFENMLNLTVINLHENHITEINRDTFVSLPNLRKLYLNQNNISTIHDKTFKYLGSLQELDLSNNWITVITRDIFHGMYSLQRLYLRDNEISMVADHTFMEMPELAELDLNQNEITFISERAFDGMRSLRKLILSENRLVTLLPDFLAGAPGVHFLDLSDNSLRTMTFDNIKPIVTNLYANNSHFDLSENNLICDCKLAWIWGLRNETKSKQLRDALKKLTCLLESNNASQKINSEDLGRNQPPEIHGDYDDDDEDDDKSENGYYDESEENSSNSNYHSKSDQRSAVNGKCCMRLLFDLKPEDLPCPEFSREDLMASEQPSSRHENARVGSSWFSSGSTSVQAGQSVLVASFLLLSILFFT